MDGPDITEIMAEVGFRMAMEKSEEVERLREVLRIIASCDKVVDGDVVDLAQRALEQSLMRG